MEDERALVEVSSSAFSARVSIKEDRKALHMCYGRGWSGRNTMRLHARKKIDKISKCSARSWEWG